LFRLSDQQMTVWVHWYWPGKGYLVLGFRRIARNKMTHGYRLFSALCSATREASGAQREARDFRLCRREQTQPARMDFMANKTPKKPVLPTSPPGLGSDDSVVLERRTQKVKPPQMFQVVLLNDDFTPMEFVVYVIQEFFSKDRETATQIMLKIHLEGKGICGVYSRDVASTKVDQVTQASREAGHPLQCVSEPVE
jgi:ATP-dependent Clp protease adaptor protein ClpS